MTTIVIVFLIAFTGLTVLISLKHWELKRGQTFLPVFRRKVDNFALVSIVVLKNHIPQKSKYFGERVAHHTAYHTSAAALKAVQGIEKQLLGFLNMIKGRGVVQSGGSASEYLQSVSEHKRYSDNIEKENV